MKYQSLSNFIYHQEEYSLTIPNLQDMMLIRKWRNEQITILRQSRTITEDDQVKYFNQVIQPTFEKERPNQILFTYCLRNKPIGYGGLTNIDWISLRAEVSFLLDTNRTANYIEYSHEFSIFMKLLKRVGFMDLGLNRLFTETYDIRDWHIATLENNNFRLEGRLRQHVLIDNQYVDSLLHGCLKEYENDER